MRWIKLTETKPEITDGYYSDLILLCGEIDSLKRKIVTGVMAMDGRFFSRGDQVYNVKYWAKITNPPK
jgi:hypothetical protein